MDNNFKKLLGMASGILLGAMLYGIGKYLVSGHTDIVILIKNSITLLIGSSIVFLIVINTQHR
ncbi:MAG: hypothetical protein PHT79_11855 [Syntrophomonadaceae bacterium]|nr:hypothetical protein [Syntrophomonadaceae bacterium]MDD3890250.1 hypothetical protein [Syntrophomonadaceae bacterium]MDD4550438.1 hypothetical protein [Syntrophomonadaceae bacterium]